MHRINEINLKSKFNSNNQLNAEDKFCYEKL